MRSRFTVMLCLLLVAIQFTLAGCGPAATPVPATSVPATALSAGAVPATAVPATKQAASVPATTVAASPATATGVAATKPAATATATAGPTAVPTSWAIKPGTLRLATTTSAADSGILDFLLPDFQAANNVKVEVVAVGTGQAIAIGQAGDADVLLVHSRSSEDAFVAAGHAKARYDVMYNDFVIIGPKEDPAKVAAAASAAAGLKAIAAAEAIFVSRGDKSGTNTKELSLWASAGITPTAALKWYNAIGQGMGDTLIFSNEKKGYTLSDRATWLATQAKLPALAIVFGGNSLAENKDKGLLNPYGVLPVNPDKHPGVQADMAMKFVNWLLSPATQQKIATFGMDKYGQQLFYPNAAK